ncbi:hypothetical protein [Natrialba swarupiae]|uniref:Uncharacterized protein n=1 Tax=Natrialba swarupiae TaxID=2448032 RepID=A0A5D5ALK3_9EURY|nr:hypothetical protein [Natrialba swarupiae]TYT61775.1 hypothetical protein FYC77_12190 [Natrialba swarupiae]
MSNTKPAKEIYEWINEKTDVEILSHSKYDNIPTPNYTFNGKGRGADLIIRASQYNYAIITKDNSSSDTVHDGATHLARYWQDYHNSAVKYVHEDDHIEIDVFLLATQDSENGHLFKSNREKKLERKSNHVEVTAGGEPPLSSTRSTTIFRVLYRFTLFHVQS